MQDFTDGPPAWREWQGQRWYLSLKMGRYRGPTGILLSNAVWASSNGPIPPGYEVHHADENKLNDDLANLRIEERDTHRKHHAADNGSKANGGDAGARAMWANRQPVERVCGQCGNTYQTRSTYSNWCSKVCKVRGRNRLQREKFGLQ